MRSIRIRRDGGAAGPRRRRRVQPLLVAGLAIAAALALVGAAMAARPPRPPTGLAAAASVDPTVQYLGDTVGTDFRFSVHNTGSRSIGAVEILRPSSAWTVVDCPAAPPDWTMQRSDNFCRYRSAMGEADDIPRGETWDDFVLRATTVPGTQNRTGMFVVRVSISSNFDSPSSLKSAPAESPGLQVRAFAFEVTDAIVGDGTVGEACPAATDENHSAITGSTQTIVVCGRNHMTIAATPVANRSFLDGTFIADDGSFSSAEIPAESAEVIVAKWTDAQVTSTSGPGQTVVARVGSATDRNSPLTTLDDDCAPSPQYQTCIENGGYEALNQPPTVEDTSATTLEDTPSSEITLTAADPDGDDVTFAVADPNNGSVDDSTPTALCDSNTPSTCTATVVYTPDPDFFDEDAFTYTATDPFTATSDPGTVTITVTPVNDAPSFTPGGDVTVDEDSGGYSAAWATGISAGPANEAAQAVTFTVGNDNNALFAVQPAVSVTGTLTFTPAADANGSATVTVDLADNGGTANGGDDHADPGTVTITVSALNDAPVATDDEGTADEDTPLAVVAPGVLGNDTDVDLDTLTIAEVNGGSANVGTEFALPSGALLTVFPSGAYSYDPNGQFEGLALGESDFDSFSYTVSDGDGGTDSATVTITIYGVNDAPTANDDADSTSEFDDVTIDVLANDTDPDATDLLTVQSIDVSGTTGLVTNNGTNVTYDPNGQFDGLEDGQTAIDTFIYTVSDGNGGTDIATVTVTIDGVTDVPPTAVDDSATIAEDAGATAIDVLTNDTNPDGGPKVIASASDPANGTVVLTGGTPGEHTGLTYEPDPNYCNDPPGTSPDTFTYTLNGGSTANVSVTVTCVDDLPTAVDDTATIAEDAAATAIDVLTNDTDVDGGSKVIASASGPANGTVVLTGGTPGEHTGLTYEPDPNYCNDPPGTSPDTFTYTLNGGSTATVSVTVTCVNDVPNAVDDSGAGFTTDEDTPFTTASVLGNDTDGDDDPLTIPTFDDTGTIGIVTYNDDGTFAYDPNGQFDSLAVGEDGTDTFTYTVSDGNGGSDVATVTITITGVNDAPDAVDDGDTTDEDTAKAVDVLGNDTDADANDTLLVTAVGAASNGGSVTITGGGTGVQFNPGADFQDLQTGQDRVTSFTYDISDGNGGTDTATVTITVTGVSDAPVADDETFDGANSAVGNTALVVDDPTDGAPAQSGAKKVITGDILDGDTDVDGPGPLTVTAGTFATNDGGSVTIEADGDFVYVPAAGTSCTDTSDFFDYTVEDSGSPELTDVGRVTIAITDCVWYVSNAATAGGNGRSTEPFDTLAEADTAATTAGATIYVFRGDGTSTGLTTATVSLGASQRLHGEAVDLVVGGTTLFTGSSGQRPNIAAGVTLDDNNSVSGVAVTGNAVPTIGAGAGDVNGTIADVVVGGNFGGILLQGTSGTWNLSDITVNTTTTLDGISVTNAGTVNFLATGTISVTHAGGRGAVITGTTTSGVIDTVTVTSSPSEGIVLDDNLGSLTINDVNLTTTGTGLMVDSSNDVTISGGDADITSGGTAVSLTTVTSNPANPPDVTLDQVTSTSGTVGILIDDIGTGTFSAAGGTLSGHSVAEIDINGGSGAVSYGGTIGNGTGLSAEITGRTGGAVTLSGNVTDTNDAGGGISLSGNTSGSTTFSGGTKTLNTGASAAVASTGSGHTLALTNGGLDIDTTTGAGFSATGGGTVTIGTGTNPNTIDTGSGTALTVTSTTIGNGGMTFRAISSNGGTNGIVLSNTGATGSLVVTGNSAGTCGTAATEADCTGGTIQNKTGDAISLASTASPSFTRVNLKNNLGSGIRATSGVSGLTVSNSRLVNNADTSGIEEAGISLNNVSGTTTITSSTIRDSFEDNIEWNGSSGTGTINVSGSTVGPTDALGNSGIQLTGTGTAALTLAVTGSTFPGNNSQAISSTFSDSSQHTVNVSTSTFTDNNMAVALGTTEDADATFDINGNTILRSKTNGIQILSGATSTPNSHVVGHIRNNAIGDANVDSGADLGHGIAIEFNDDADGVVSITGNTIRHVDQQGIFYTSRDIASDVGADATVDLHVRDNAILEIDDNEAFPFGTVYGMLIDVRHHSTMCLDIWSNLSSSVGGVPHIRVRQRDTSVFRMERLTDNDGINDGINTNSTNVSTFVASQNDAGTTAEATLVIGYTVAVDGICRDP